jgi:hypothetical protein
MVPRDSDTSIVPSRLGKSSFRSAASTNSRSSRSDSLWEDRILKFVEYAAIEDRTYRLQRYRQVFIGKEMVDSLVYHKIVKNRREAVVVGRVLQRDYLLFVHAGGPCSDGTGVSVRGTASFSDAAYFYRFNLETVKKYVKNYDETIATWAANLADEDIVGSFREETEYGLEDGTLETLMLERELSTLILEDDCNHSNQQDQFSPSDHSVHASEIHPQLQMESPRKARDDDSLLSSISTWGFMQSHNLTETKMQQAKDFIRVAFFLKRDRYFHMRKYKDVFVGSELVTELIKEEVVKSRSEAVQLGRLLEKDLSLFRHVCGDHRFGDVWYFYRFRPRVLEFLGEHAQVEESQHNLYSSLWTKP